MVYTFSLDESDYLTYQLFNSSTSKQSLKNRRRSWLLVTGAFALLAFVTYNNKDEVLGIYFGVLSIISFIFYPFYIRWKYKKHFLSHIREHLASNFGKKASLEFQKDYILAFDENESESKINLKSVKSIHELPEHHLIRLDGGQTLILPKQKTNNLHQLESDLNQLAKSLGLTIMDNTKWTWNKSW
ncbi:YcxB family protein [Echinicola sp. CAU 1574]|uniref:YcxB family protein n=1 Tax=Echinicola arenosa TaxID=2774144 RepID=A0ABR9AN78_9BACT|nr:YcxB family protein [Echinicola arenosa]MBD8489756.1 YcxB family protein [Echinicola arenosa]